MIEHLVVAIAGLAAGMFAVTLAQQVRTPRRRKTDVPSRHPARHSTGLTARNRLGTYTIPRPRSGADN